MVAIIDYGAGNLQSVKKALDLLLKRKIKDIPDGVKIKR